MTANTFTNAQCLAEALAISGLAEGIDTLLFESPDKEDTKKNLEAVYAVSQVLRDKSKRLSHMLDSVCDQAETPSAPRLRDDTHFARVNQLENQLNDIEGLVAALETIAWDFCQETIADPALLRIRSAVIALSSSLDRVMKDGALWDETSIEAHGGAA